MLTTRPQKPTSPLVSVIVPIFNAELCLPRCLESIIKQTLPNLEILCVDDGSTDNSLQILQHYAQKDRRLRIFTQKNQGPGGARNLALDHARGKYIQFCDADDTLEPDACRQCSAIMASETVDIVLFQSNLIEVSRTAHNAKNTKNQSIVTANFKRTGKLNKKTFLQQTGFYAVWKYFYARDLINRHHLRFTHYAIGEDAVFTACYFMLISNGYVLNQRLHNYYAYEKSLSGVNIKTSLSPIYLKFLCQMLSQTWKFALKNHLVANLWTVYYSLFIWLKTKFL